MLPPFFLIAASTASFEFSGTSFVTVIVSPANSYVVVMVTILADASLEPPTVPGLEPEPGATIPVAAAAT